MPPVHHEASCKAAEQDEESAENGELILRHKLKTTPKRSHLWHIGPQDEKKKKKGNEPIFEHILLHFGTGKPFIH